MEIPLVETRAAVLSCAPTMADESHEIEVFTDLYRFAWILLMREDLAQKIVSDAVDEVWVSGRRPHEDSERACARMFQVVRQRALKVPGSQPGDARKTPVRANGWPADALLAITQGSTQDVITALHRVPEPGRSALALVLLDAVDHESIERILGLTVPQLADELDRARSLVAGNLQMAGEGGQ